VTVGSIILNGRRRVEPQRRNRRMPNRSTDPIVERFERLARDGPNVALVARAGSTPITRGAVDAQAREAARLLQSAGLSETPVGLAAGNGASFLAAFVSLRRAGCAVVLLDPRAPEADSLRTAAGLGAGAVLFCGEAFSVKPVPARDAVAYPADCAVVKVTSGSTGSPRGVAASADALLADESALFRSMGLRDDERILAAIPMNHSYGLSSAALPALARGSLLVLPELPGPLSAVAAAHAAGATFFPTVPAYLRAIVEMSQPPRWPDSLRLFVSAGEPLAPSSAARFRELYGRPVHAFYGASECGGICYDREGGAAERGSVGTPVDGVRVELEAGVVLVRSPAVGSGYLPTPQPSLGGGSFRSNDVARWQDGELRLQGRADATINVKGKKVEPSEIERVVAALPGVEEVVALGLRRGESQHVGVVIACRSRRLTYWDVQNHCRLHLAEHKLPRSIVFVDEIPRTSRGKPDRTALAELAEAGRER
jgi:acyl-CoA synthetase (AMP-forming)/AMP-acid ligase II